MARQVRDLAFQRSGIASIGPDLLDPTEAPGQQPGEQGTRSVPVLNACRGDRQAENKALRVYQDVSLSSCNFLTRIKTTNSGLASCSNALAIEDRSRGGFFLPAATRARSRSA